MVAQLLEEIALALPPPNVDGFAVFRQWFQRCGVQVYLRVGQRGVLWQAVRTLELSNVTVDEGARGQGRFSSLLDGLSELAHLRGEALFVESVLSEIVRGALLRRGFTDYRGDGMNYIKTQPTKQGDQ